MAQVTVLRAPSAAVNAARPTLARAAIGANYAASAVDFEPRAVKNEEIRSENAGGIGG